MSKNILIPDIGGAKSVDVIAVLVKPGDTIAVDTPLATLEGDKASMDIPSSDAGVVESVLIKVGDNGSVMTVQFLKNKVSGKGVISTRLPNSHFHNSGKIA